MRRLLRGSVAWLTLAALAGCALPAGRHARQAADAIAAAGALEPRTVEAGAFRLLTFHRGLDTAGAVSVYLEGDGRAWRGRRPPRDPTPPDPVGLRLAARDPGPAVLWIGRPCMYLEEALARHCAPRWWTSHRYAPQVVEALLRALDEAVGTGRAVVLIGHSGGGALATLLAARRPRVAGLITIGAPLDLEWWVRHHDLTPLTGSLDPIAVAPALGDLPQRHLAGGRDRVVPAEAARRFVRALPRRDLARVEIHPQQAHECCWIGPWPGLRLQPFATAALGSR